MPTPKASTVLTRLLRTLSALKAKAGDRTAMPLSKGVLVLVGDKKTIMEQIGQAGLSEPVELDADGQPVK